MIQRIETVFYGNLDLKNTGGANGIQLMIHNNLLYVYQILFHSGIGVG